MDKRKRISILVAGALVLVAAFGAFTYRTVRAQDPTPTPEQPAQAQPDPGDRGFRGMKPGAGGEELADALGITVEELQAAQQAAQANALEQAVAQGLITQEQADQLAERGFGKRGLGRWLQDSEIDLQALLAEELGISVEALQAAQQEAFAASLEQAVADGRLTQEQADLLNAQQALASDAKFQASMQAAFEAAVQQAVEDGLITQAQADALLASQGSRGFPGWGGFGGRGHGRHGGMDGFFPHNDGETPTTPTTNG